MPVLTSASPLAVPDPGTVLGIAEIAVPYTFTTVMTSIPGMAVTVNVAVGTHLQIKAECGWLLMGATATFFDMQLTEDGTAIVGCILNEAANLSSPFSLEKYRTVTVAGPHTYALQGLISVASAGATFEAGTVGGVPVVPHLKVSVG